MSCILIRCTYDKNALRQIETKRANGAVLNFDLCDLQK
jgi:hypothetical protein